jgi:hypothetical protein
MIAAFFSRFIQLTFFSTIESSFKAEYTCGLVSQGLEFVSQGLEFVSQGLEFVSQGLEIVSQGLELEKNITMSFPSHRRFCHDGASFICQQLI